MAPGHKSSRRPRYRSAGRDASLGYALAAHLGASAVVLMRGHGFTAVGSDVAQAIFRAVYTAENCRLQIAALTLGTPHYLSDAEATTCAVSISGQSGRAWDLWVVRFGQFELTL